MARVGDHELQGSSRLDGRPRDSDGGLTLSALSNLVAARSDRPDFLTGACTGHAASRRADHA